MWSKECIALDKESSPLYNTLWITTREPLFTPVRRAKNFFLSELCLSEKYIYIYLGMYIYIYIYLGTYTYIPSYFILSINLGLICLINLLYTSKCTWIKMPPPTNQPFATCHNNTYFVHPHEYTNYWQWMHLDLNLILMWFLDSSPLCYRKTAFILIYGFACDPL